jgi:Tol biopolymer transport system component
VVAVRRLIALASMRAARLLLLAALLGGLLGFGGPAQATFPGRNGRIAYSVGPIFPQEPPAPSQVFTINPDGSGRRQLTDVPADKTAGSPAWSPDGSRIAYVSNVRGDLELWVMAADGSGQHPVTSDPGFAHFEPSWSPDGRKLAFFSNKGGFQGAVWTADADGGNLRRLTAPALEGFWPDWSPNGRRIVFSDNCCLPFSNVWVMQANGRGQRRLTNLREPEQAFFGSYSPDGRRLAVYAELGPTPDALTAGVYTMDAGGGPLVPVFTIDQPDVILFDWGTAP